MKIYHIYRTDDYEFDEYTEAIVIAPSPKKAQYTHPSDRSIFKDGAWSYIHDGKEIPWPGSDWPMPEHVSVEYLGEAKKSLKAGVISANFLAG